MKTLTNLLVLFFILITAYSFGQTTLKGKVVDEKGIGLPGANVSLKGSYDGATADVEGNFQFKTTEKGEQIIQSSFIGYEAYNQTIILKNGLMELTLKMRETANELNTVTVTAGTFEASDEKKTTLIKPIDIVTTAGGGADITQTMTLLTPGSQRNGESTGMFVRGGSAQESKILIDGITVQNAYNTASPDVAARSRFSPFQFKGSAFSTGGYSAQYGQALSAVLQMNTTDLATESGYVINANLAQLSAGYTQLTDNHSINGTVAYSNLTPLFSVYPQNIEWKKIPEQLNISTSYRLKPSSGENLKFDAIYGKSASGMLFKNPDNNNALTEFGIKNDNLLLTSSYQKALDKDANWVLKSGASYSYNFDNLNAGTSTFGKTEQRSQLRATLTHSFGENNNILFGTEGHSAQYELSVQQNEEKNNNRLTDNFGALFSESEFYITRKLAGRIGVRGEYSSLASGFNLAPRFSLAYKTGQYSQVSMAGGKFYQTPDYRYYFYNKNLQYEQAAHAVLNYQIIKNKRTFRVEGYYKKYENLVREYPSTAGYFDANPQRFPNGKTDNAGYGFAQGVDVFFRDSKTVKNGDLWVNYSYCDSKRLFANYLTEAQPTFVSNHNLNVVYKHFIAKPMMTISGTYSYTSGRPYYNPNVKEFLSERTPDVHNTSVWLNYLTNIKGNFMVIYLSVDNILGTKNVYNYRYSTDGKTRTEITPAAYRTIMIGTYITISKKKVLPEDMRKN
ncbi:outer membrane cobalamin receptor [Arcicella aurantiaca]|uniref:Outer membrane cobalamin receptor n=1 Tax=Arcicella aurantiaca TaxID=591202 RepID=A0A316EFE3_9BACT|nr:TonB-dependent receptor [Arcicella aurantiaca]PWK28467.1 outer membrane cobalamin receptor [Arcicella aurantiaca]